MTINIDTWYKNHVNRNTDVDGYYGSQCWDLWANYCVEVLGLPHSCTNTSSRGRNAYLAGSIYEQFPLNDTLKNAFVKLPPNITPQKGDVAFWGNDPTHPSTHVAIVIESGMGNGRIHVLAQNVDTSMAARDMWDTAATDGYLRPKTNINKTGELTMNDIQKIAGAVWSYVYDGRTTVYNYQYLTYDRVQDARKEIAELKTMLTAQTAAIEALSKSMGADPTTIATAVQKAVTDKLNKLEINITAK